MLLKFIQEQEEIKKIKYFPKNRRKCLLMHRADCNQTNHIGIYKKVNPLLATKQSFTIFTKNKRPNCTMQESKKKSCYF